MSWPFPIAPVVLIVVSSTVLSPAPGDRLGELEAKIKTAQAEKDYAKSMPLFLEAQDGVVGMIEDDKLKTASDFRRAAGLFAPISGDLLPLEAQYELMLTATAEGDVSARRDMALRWDNLLLGMGRRRRIGVVEIKPSFGEERFVVEPTAKVVVDVYTDYDQAVLRAKSGKANPEIKALVDADQKARAFDFSKATPKELDDMAKGDAGRLKRVKEIAFAGGLMTADDFANAALVCQHGVVFEDYALAHELSVCALMLGKRDASWLAGASYDRMLVNCGIPQRFATQYGGFGGYIKLQRYEAAMMNDTERKLIVRMTLEQAKNRKWD